MGEDDLPPEGSSASAQGEADENDETELSTGLILTLKASQIEAIWALGNEHAAQGDLLAKMVSLDQTGENFRNEALTDFYLYNLVHCKSIGLTARQAAVYHSIMELMMNAMHSKPATGSSPNPSDLTSASECFKRFEILIRDHSVARPPKNLAIFFGSQARLLTDFASMTFFKHFLLYQYLHYNEREFEALRFDMSYEEPLGPPDLSAARLLRADRRLGRKSGGTGASTGGASGGGNDPTPRYRPPAETPEVKDLTEDEEIEQLVEAKLHEVRTRLDNKLEDRKRAFTAKMEAEAAEAATKGKKK